jgi:hypothetical protein
MQNFIWHKLINKQKQFLTINVLRRWRSVGSHAKLKRIQYLYLYVASSSEISTLQGSPQKHMGIGTPLESGFGTYGLSVIRP